MKRAKADLKIAKAIIKGDEKVFNQFFKEYYPKIYRFVLLRVNHDQDLADDFTQQALCTALDKMSGFRGEASLYTWVCQISRSVISKHFAKENRRNNIIQPVTDNEEVREILDKVAMNDTTEPDNIAARLELNQLIGEILDNLPGNYGDILELKYVEQMSVHQIAEQMNTSQTSVQSSLARARGAFRTVLEKMFNNESIKQTLSLLMER